jgi:hypothetical protein
VQRPSIWIGIILSVAFVAMVVAVCAHFWTAIGGPGISSAGWLAMGLGILATLGLGIGLMSLVFISNRRGYDELGRGER